VFVSFPRLPSSAEELASGGYRLEVIAYDGEGNVLDRRDLLEKMRADTIGRRELPGRMR
jgi:hypothetical protein